MGREIESHQGIGLFAVKKIIFCSYVYVLHMYLFFYQTVRENVYYIQMIKNATTLKAFFIA
jgi:hypothetical protein